MDLYYLDSMFLNVLKYGNNCYRIILFEISFGVMHYLRYINGFKDF